MKSSRRFLPFVIALVATPLFLCAALASAGAGHGHYLWAKILFPFTMLSARVFGSITNPFIALAIVQFPLYGLILANANVKARYLPSLVTLLVVHCLAVAACFLLLRENFS
jgi:hypothetical protein